MALRVWIFTRAPENQDYWTYQLPPRLMEFLWGVMVGQLYLSNTQPPRWLRNGIGALLALAVAFAGRLLMMTEVVHAAGRFAPLCTVAGVPLLSLGYALIVWNVILTPSVFQRALCSRPALVVGRYSYSLYLWHWYPLMWMGGFAAHRMGQTNVGLGVTFLFLLVVLIGIASLSYRLFEAPYFERSKILV
jgi:peptidoglycan/LPS O-acetylase OafA/YrhL